MSKTDKKKVEDKWRELKWAKSHVEQEMAKTDRNSNYKTIKYNKRKTESPSILQIWFQIVEAHTKEVKSLDFVGTFPFLFQFLSHFIVARIRTLDLTLYHLYSNT